MAQYTVYLPDEIFAEAKRLGINISKLTKEIMLEAVKEKICPTCGQEIPKK